MKKVNLCLLLLGSTICYGQYSYITGVGGAIYSLDIQSGCSTTLIAQFPSKNFSDIAVTPTGTIYLCSIDSLYRFIPGNPATYISLGEFSSKDITGMVVGTDGMIYASGQGLTKYDPATTAFTFLGNFPASASSAGDMVIYKGRMYMSSNDGKIYEINTTNPGLSTLFYDLGVSDLYGMVTLLVKCNDGAGVLRVIAFEPVDLSTSRAYMIDMENKTTFPQYCGVSTAISGSADFNAAVITGEEIRIDDILAKPPSCNEMTDGSITVKMVPSVVNIYSFSINGQPDGSRRTFENLPPGNHTLRVKTQFGCYIDTTITIKYPGYGCNDPLYIPSAFTPNKDGLNETFGPASLIPAVNFKMTIYNRYGRLLFQSSSVSASWDGTYKSVRQPPGIYIWEIQYHTVLGERVLRKGTVALIR